MEKRDKEEMSRREFLKIVGVSTADRRQPCMVVLPMGNRLRPRLPHWAKCLWIK